VARFPDAAAMRALVDAGADVDAFDADRETALHAAARSRPARRDAVELLLVRGAHADVASARGGLTAERLLETDGQTELVATVRRHVSLQCLAARCISARRLDYARALPRRLHAFIQLH